LLTCPREIEAGVAKGQDHRLGGQIASCGKARNWAAKIRPIVGFGRTLYQWPQNDEDHTLAA